MSSIDMILLGLCLYSVAVSMLCLTATKKLIDARMLLVGAVEVLKLLEAGDAELVKSGDTISIKRKGEVK